MFGGLIGHIVGFGLPLVGVGLLAGAVAADMLLPAFGRVVGITLLLAGGGVFAFDSGYRFRASLDNSAEYVAQLARVKADDAAQIAALKAEAAETSREIAAAQAMAANELERQRNADDHISQMQEKVDAYELALSERRAPSCALSDADVGGLLGIGSPRGGPNQNRAPHAPRAPDTTR